MAWNVIRGEGEGGGGGGGVRKTAWWTSSAFPAANTGNASGEAFFQVPSSSKAGYGRTGGGSSGGALDDSGLDDHIPLPSHISLTSTKEWVAQDSKPDDVVRSHQGEYERKGVG